MNFKVGLNYSGDHKPFTFINLPSFDLAMDTLTQAPASELRVWNGHQWVVLFDGHEEFTGVKPENWI